MAKRGRRGGKGRQAKRKDFVKVTDIDWHVSDGATDDVRRRRVVLASQICSGGSQQVSNREGGGMELNNHQEFGNELWCGVQDNYDACEEEKVEEQLAEGKKKEVKSCQTLFGKELENEAKATFTKGGALEEMAAAQEQRGNEYAKLVEENKVMRGLIVKLKLRNDELETRMSEFEEDLRAAILLGQQSSDYEDD